MGSVYPVIICGPVLDSLFVVGGIIGLGNLCISLIPLSFTENSSFTEAVENARECSRTTSLPIRLGFSPINPYQDVFDRHFYGDGFQEQFSTIMVPISGEFKGFTEELRTLGSHVDVIPYFLGNELMPPLCREFCLALIPMRITLSLSHPLAEKEALDVEDLNGQELITLADSVNSAYRGFHERIRQKAPDVRFRPVGFIDFSTLNEAVARRSLLLVGDHMRNSHPLLRFLPLRGPFLLPYGLYYSLTPSPNVQRFLDAFRGNGISGEVADAPIVSFGNDKK